jgi:2-polyprenyl-3-methyl-5-hydroxy-6-metoxy-1,4-benzoquinol methylase
MNDSSRHAHWEQVYTTKGEREVSWFQECAEPSMELLRAAGANADTRIIDIGGGASRLVDTLVHDGFQQVTVLDLSEAALSTARARLGARAGNVQWIAADVTRWEPAQTFDIWHDRAAFHFLTENTDRAAYVNRLRRAVKPGGHVILGTFALDGPERCSGLAVVRYSGETLAYTLGADFRLVGTISHLHKTPWDSQQSFQFSTFHVA